MILGIDHIAIAVRDPDAAVEELAWLLGVPAGESGGRHEAWGTRNRLLWLRDTYIELCTVGDPALARDSWLGRPALAALPGPAAICWALSSNDLENDRDDMNARGAGLGAPIPGERRRPDGRIVRWRLALPQEVALDRPFLIDHDMSAAEWSSDDRAERAATPGRLTALELPVDEVRGLAPDDDTMQFGNQTVRLAGTPTLQPTIRIAGVSRQASTPLIGCRWVLE